LRTKSGAAGGRPDHDVSTGGPASAPASAPASVPDDELPELLVDPPLPLVEPDPLVLLLPPLVPPEEPLALLPEEPPELPCPPLDPLELVVPPSSPVDACSFVPQFQARGAAKQAR
jgi:hypothetical protein